MGFPSVIVECAFDANEDETLYATGGWTDITQWVNSISGFLRGRNQYETGKVEAGTLTIDLDNLDGRFTPNGMSPYWPNIEPDKRLRIRGKNMVAANIARGGGADHSASLFSLPNFASGFTTGVGAAQWAQSDSTYLRGVNVSGGEFGTTIPGVYDVDYHYDSQASFNYLAGRGIKVVRLPFLWERIQRTLSGPLDPGELTRLKNVVGFIYAAGMKAILDVHNYGRYNTVALGAFGGPTSADFQDLWRKLSFEFDGNPGIYAYGLMNEPHDLPGFPGSLVGNITHYDFESTSQGWVGESGVTVARTTSTVLEGVGSLQATKTMTSGADIIRFNDASGLVDNLSAYGDSVAMQVMVPLSAAGSDWKARIEVQNSSFVWQSQNAINLTKGVMTELTWTPTAGLLSNCRAIGVQFEATGVNQSQTVYIDTVRQGTMAEAISPVQQWQSLAQDAVNAIRVNGDDTMIQVAGYSWSNADNWANINGAPWISDPMDNTVYEVHFYFDTDHSGTYTNSYDTENSTAIGQGYADLTDRATKEISVFTNWLTTYNVRGFVGEIGWPKTDSRWNTVASAVYAKLGPRIGITNWAAGEWYGTAYALSVYQASGSVLNTANQQATVIEANATQASAPVLDQIEVTVAAGQTGTRRLVAWMVPIETGTRLTHSAYIWNVSGTEPVNSVLTFEVFYFDNDGNELLVDLRPKETITGSPTVPRLFSFSHAPYGATKYALAVVSIWFPTVSTTDLKYAFTGIQSELPSNLAPNPSGLFDLVHWQPIGSTETVVRHSGTGSAELDWNGSVALQQIIPHLIPGETYSVAAEVFKTGTSPNILMSADDGMSGSILSVEDTWTTLNIVFEAKSISQSVKFIAQGTATSGDILRIRGLNVQKVNNPSLPIASSTDTGVTAWERPKDVFEGWVEEWPWKIENGESKITVIDRLARIGQITLTNTLPEALMSDNIDLVIPFNDELYAPTVGWFGNWAEESKIAAIPYSTTKGDLSTSNYALGVAGPTDESAINFNPVGGNLKGYFFEVPYSKLAVPVIVTPPSSSTPPPAPMQQYTRTWWATWSRTYRGDTYGTRWDDSPYMYQGSWDGTGGNYRAMAGFYWQDMMAALSGAEILSVVITLTNQHWRWNSGGNVGVGTHSVSSKPSSWSNSYVWARRWVVWYNSGQTRSFNVDLSVGYGFADGTTKGITIGPGAGGSLPNNDYGYFRGATQGGAPHITITWRR